MIKKTDRLTNSPLSFSDEIDAKAKRMLKSRQQNPNEQVWFGLGMMGLVGWSVVIPTLVGVVTGIWLDRGSSHRYSWTLMLMIGGLLLGCLNAWYWVEKQDQEMHEDLEDDNG